MSELSIFVDVVGRASARWRSAKNAAEAAELNERLSNRRATGVARVIERQLRRHLQTHPVRIIVTGTGLVWNDTTSTIPVEWRGLGSRNPIIEEGNTGNDSLNRSVSATINAAKYETKSTVTTSPALYLSLSNVWDIEILRKSAAALIWGAGDVRFRLTNPISGKSRLYEAKLIGEGLDNPLSDFELKNPGAKPSGDFTKAIKLPKPDTPEKITFTTGKFVGFGAFEGNKVSLWKGKAGVGIGIPWTTLQIGAAVSVVTFGFSGLGGTSDSIMIEFETELSGTTIGGFDLQGTSKAIDKHPGDFKEGVFNVYGERTYPMGNKEDGILILFETGSDELSEEAKKYIEGWAKRWAHTFAAANPPALKGRYHPRP